MASLAFAVMAITVGMVLVRAWQGWRDNTESLGVQRDARLAMVELGREIRNSKISEITGDSDGLYFTADDVRTYDLTFGKDRIATSPGVVLESWTDPVIGSNYVGIAFSLSNSRGTDVRVYSTTFFPRN
ncbi:hypothetical protein [Pontiella desulfatans]|nr:hypothetical protein [Pontiella desulfatans]